MYTFFITIPIKPPVFKFRIGIGLNFLLPRHPFALQVSVSVAEPVHGAPPFDAGVASDLVRVLEPPPHVSEQLDQSPYSPHTQSTATTCENKTYY